MFVDIWASLLIPKVPKREWFRFSSPLKKDMKRRQNRISLHTKTAPSISRQICGQELSFLLTPCRDYLINPETVPSTPSPLVTLFVRRNYGKLNWDHLSIPILNHLYKYKSTFQTTVPCLNYPLLFICSVMSFTTGTVYLSPFGPTETGRALILCMFVYKHLEAI